MCFIANQARHQVTLIVRIAIWNRNKYVIQAATAALIGYTVVTVWGMCVATWFILRQGLSHTSFISGIIDVWDLCSLFVTDTINTEYFFVIKGPGAMWNQPSSE